LAQLFGAEAEEIAIMRNTTEAMQTVLLGLDFKAGDEVLTTEHDYFSLVGALDRREARDGIVVKKIAIPVPPGSMDELAAAFERGITDKTRLILVSHPVNFTGQFFPIKQICDLAHSKGIEVAVDGAHSFAHLDFKHQELDCDYYATSLHKWLFAPKGTGMLYVRRDKIAKVWPLLYSSQRMENNVRKFEAFGTRAYGPFLAIGEAVAFHNGIGAKRKEERLRYLKHYWADRLQAMPKVQFYSSLDPDMGCAIATVGIDGVNARALGTYLMDKHQILSAPVTRLGINGLRITPSLYTTLEELDNFCNIMEHIAKNGLPSS
jgi:selenocysteine lyase/cysteine desulfurase